MSELATAATGARPAGIIAKRSRRAAVALTMSIGAGLLMMSVWRGSPSALFLRTIMLALSATAAFGPSHSGNDVADLTFSPLRRVSAPPFWRDPDRMNGWTHLTFAAILLAPCTALAAIVRQKEPC